MTDTKAGSASNNEASGSAENEINGKVAYETYKRVLDEAKKAKEQLREAANYKAQLEESKLKEQNEWKALADQYKKQLDSTSQTLQEQEKSIMNGLKYHEFEKQLGGKLKDREYATFIDFEKIVVNPESKKVEEESVKVVVSEFLKKHSSLVEFPGGAKLPNQAGASVATPGLEKDIKSMSREEIEAAIRKIGIS